MNLRRLRYTEELNFGRAALWEGVRQPPSSQQIGKLEQELGVRLFERMTRHVLVTPAGQAIVTLDLTWRTGEQKPVVHNFRALSPPPPTASAFPAAR
ncbi:LysR family transcriptional regulator [Nonomuraea sp. B12E4]|uniref:LysR family transcriptional regulator n=1 Tax=Nonomuraea sp. B12E4 TaxID=3153564 RepID=UPI00325D4F76